jgi:hypothetical protein
MKKLKDVIVGLDISSSVVGISVFNKELELIDLLSLNYKKEKIENYLILFTKVELFREKLVEYLETNSYSLYELRIEANAKAFSSGKTTAHTLFTLAKINALICYTIWNTFPDAKIKEVQVATARKKIGFKKDNKSSKKIKEQVFDFTLQKYKEVLKFLPTKTLKSGPRKGTVDYEDYAKDMIDAFVIAIGS